MPANHSNRCFWVNQNPKMIAYHDKEWGRPVHDDRMHFEMLCLEGAQAGLSWETILNKREGYKKCFANFQPQRCARLTDARLEKLLENPAIVRNRLKVYSVRQNARAFLAIQKEFGSFDKYIWSFVDGKPLETNIQSAKQSPVKTEISDQISKDLKKRGFKFVGSTIIYAYMEASGLTQNHVKGCKYHGKKLRRSKT